MWVSSSAVGQPRPHSARHATLRPRTSCTVSVLISVPFGGRFGFGARVGTGWLRFDLGRTLGLGGGECGWIVSLLGLVFRVCNARVA